jgi:hypothetical protein
VAIPSDWPLTNSLDPEGNQAGEFTGVDGILKPPPHQPEAWENLILDYRDFAAGE